MSRMKKLYNWISFVCAILLLAGCGQTYFGSPSKGKAKDETNNPETQPDPKEAYIDLKNQLNLATSDRISDGNLYRGNELVQSEIIKNRINEELQFSAQGLKIGDYQLSLEIRSDQKTNPVWRVISFSIVVDQKLNPIVDAKQYASNPFTAKPKKNVEIKLDPIDDITNAEIKDGNVSDSVLVDQSNETKTMSTDKTSSASCNPSTALRFDNIEQDVRVGLGLDFECDIIKEPGEKIKDYKSNIALLQLKQVLSPKFDKDAKESLLNQHQYNCSLLLSSDGQFSNLWIFKSIPNKLDCKNVCTRFFEDQMESAGVSTTRKENKKCFWGTEELLFLEQ